MKITRTKAVFFQGLIILTTSISNTAFATTEAQPKTDFPQSIITTAVTTAGIKTAWYDDATTRYAHGVLGDAIEAGSLHAKTVDGKMVSVILDTAQVFEDVQPRLADIDGDGQNEIITIRSHNRKGAQIAIYDIDKALPNKLTLVASTPYIGTANRWLAPVGIADFDNDGSMDIAYIDRPHLAKILRVWSYRDGGLQQVAQKRGLTNHKIGHNYITGGVRTCGNQASMITVDSHWGRLIKTTLNNDKLTSEDIGPYTGANSAKATLNCS